MSNAIKNFDVLTALGELHPGAAHAAPVCLARTIADVQDAIRQHPCDDKLRVHLFQRYAQAGQWHKALAQLQVAAKLNPDHTMLAHAYRLALRAELLRDEVFRGNRSPRVLGQPRPWVSYLIDALAADSRGESARAMELRASAFDNAAPIPGNMDGQAFEWIADADQRIGPVLEIYANGDYYWAPFEHIAYITLDIPTDLRDLVWLPAQLKLVNEGLHAALLPARYPLLDVNSEDGLLQSRLTTWIPLGTQDTDAWQGHGVKVIASNVHEASILDIRHIQLTA